MDSERGTAKAQSELRQVAEDLLKRGVLTMPDVKGLELRRLIHELHVYHAELEMQHSELRETHTALEEARRRYQELFQFAPVGYVLLDRQGLIVEMNEASCELLGVRRDATGTPFSVFVGSEDHETFFRHLLDVFTHERKRTVEIRCRRRDQGAYPALLSSCLWPQTHPDRALALCLLIDISERKRLEEELLQAQKMEAVGQLAGGVAHDFNNRILIIKGRCELLRDRTSLCSEMRGALDEIEDAAERAAQLTQQLLAFARRQVLQPRLLDLNDVVSRMTNILLRALREDIELVVRLAPELGTVRSDPTQIEQVLFNLAVNARDAMPDGGVLTIETWNTRLDAAWAREWGDDVPPGEYVRLVVTDTGTGMTPDVRARIFEPFFTTKAAGYGTGLGLSTVYGIVKQSGGGILCSSALGSGTTFEIVLPAVEAEPEALRPHTGGGEAPKGHETILLVEDEDGVRAVVREILALGGYSVMSAADANEALAVLASHGGRVDLLLTDVVLPGKSGTRLAEEVQRLHPGIRIIFMSGYPLVGFDRQAARRDFLVKPFNLQTLLAKIREILDG